MMSQRLEKKWETGMTLNGNNYVHKGQYISKKDINKEIFYNLIFLNN